MCISSSGSRHSTSALMKCVIDSSHSRPEDVTSFDSPHSVASFLQADKNNHGVPGGRSC